MALAVKASLSANSYEEIVAIGVEFSFVSHVFEDAGVEVALGVGFNPFHETSHIKGFVDLIKAFNLFFHIS